MIIKKPYLLIKNIGLVAVSAALCPLGLANAAESSTSMTLVWDPDPTANIQDYRIYVGTQSGQYSQNYGSGTLTSIAINQLQVGLTYYFAVVAISITGLESPLSSELVVTLAPPPLPTESMMTVAATGGIELQWTFPTAALTSSPEFIVEASADLVNWLQVATVDPNNSPLTAGPSQHFSWAAPITPDRMFYRLTGINWLGRSTGS